jgi:hypothetical protein
MGVHLLLGISFVECDSPGTSSPDSRFIDTNSATVTFSSLGANLVVVSALTSADDGGFLAFA